MDSLLQDLRYGFRRLRKSPGFTITALLTLTLGIGANTSIFTVVNAVLLRALPFRDPGQIVFVRELQKEPDNAFGGMSISIPNLEDYRQQQHAFDQLSAWMSQSVNLTGQERPDRVIGGFVSANFFKVFEVDAERGRTFVAGEDQPGAAPAVVISNGAWKTRFGADANILGRKVTLNGEPFTVVGVLPASFSFPLVETDVWMPITHYPNYKLDRSNKSQAVIGRIRSGVTKQQASEQLNVVAQRLAQEYPQVSKGIHADVIGIQELNAQNIRGALLVLLGAVGLILLIASSNIANLLLARSIARSKEIAVRVALGASRGDLMKQLLAEALLLSISGGVLGLLLAKWGVTFLVHLSPTALPLAEIPALDSRVLMFTLAISLLTGLFFGLLPAFQSSNPDLRSVLSATGRTAGESTGSSRLRSAFVISQVALSVMLLIGAGLMIKSFAGLLRVDPGFDPQNLLTAEYRLPRNKYPTIAEQWLFHQQVVRNAAQIPGVVSAATVLGLPFSGNFNGNYHFTLPEMAPVEKGLEPTAVSNAASPEYFSTIGLTLLKGRTFDDRDTQNSPHVAIVSRSFVKKYWPNEDPIGRRVHLVDDNFDATVVGVVNDSKYLSLRDEDSPAIYFPTSQRDRQIFATLVLRTAIEPNSLSQSLREAIWKVDKDQPVWKIRTVQYLIERDLSPDKFVMILMIGFAGLALILSAIGTYGVISYSVTQRTPEIGLRIALGATSRDVLRLVVTQGVRLAAIGAALGALVSLMAAFTAGHLLQRLLFGVKPHDPLTFVSVLVVLMLIAVLACYLPARRAASVDPMIALRYE